MSNLNICLCGSQAGYPHHIFCPYPIFLASPDDQEKWLKEYNEAKRQFALNHKVDDEEDEHVLDVILQELNEMVMDDQDLSDDGE
jgi:hypothetical protein